MNQTLRFILLPRRSTNRLYSGLLFKSRAGFTLTELAIVLGIMGVILSAIWVAASRVSSANKVQKTSGQILAIESGYQSLYAQRGIDTPQCFGISGPITCMGQSAGVFPADMIPSGASCNQGDTTTWPHSPWGGLVWADACQSNNTVVISYFNLSPAACASLAASVLNAPGVSFEGIGDGANTRQQWLAPIANNTPWNLATITSYCDGTANEVQIGFQAR
jgi:prepilin-type N-terminal cleavage/methylation domain-containing protein